jgi:proline iminopeptidase
VLVDPRGTGGTGPAESYSLDDYVGDLEDLREQLGLDAIELLGFSHGGIVAMAYAARLPTRVGKLVLASTIAAVTEETAGEMEAVKSTKAGEPWFADAVAALEQEERGDYDDATFAAMWKAMAPMYFSRWDERYRPWLESSTGGSSSAPLKAFEAEPFDLRPELGRIDVQTLVITGADDFICGPAAAAAIGVPGARVVILDGAGHMTFLEQREAFCAAVEEFLLA